MAPRENTLTYYRRKAEEMTRAAEAATDPGVRKAFEDIAQSWLELVKEHERRV
jgi:hypothetical protein